MRQLQFCEFWSYSQNFPVIWKTPHKNSKHNHNKPFIFYFLFFTAVDLRCHLFILALTGAQLSRKWNQAVEAVSLRHPQNTTRVSVQHFQVKLAEEITFPHAIALKIKVMCDNSTCKQRDSAGYAGESGAMQHRTHDDNKYKSLNPISLRTISLLIPLVPLVS